MANPNLTRLIDEVTETEGVIDSAVAFINGVPALISAAIAQALANGATEQELAPLQTLAADLDAKSQALAVAVAANSTL